MAYLAATVLLNALAELSEKSNKDLRAPEYGATLLFNKYKKDVILNYDEFNNIENQSDLQTKQIDYLRRSSESVGSARSATLTGAMGLSTRDTLTFVTYQREFTIADDVVRNNTQKAVKLLQNQLVNARLDIGASIETAAVAKLEANKNTVQGNRTLGTWDSGAYVMEVAIADKAQYYNYIKANQAELDYTGVLQEVHTGSLTALGWYYEMQGTGNSANTQFQFPDFERTMSTSITNATDYFGTSYVVPAASVGLVDWIPGKNREGLDHGLWEFTAIPDPFGIFDRMALAVYKTVIDGQSTGGGTQDARWLYELSVDVAFFTPTITTQKIVNKYGLTLA